MAVSFAIVAMGQKEFDSKSDCEETSVDTTYVMENGYVVANLIHHQICEVYDRETHDIGNLFRSFPTKDTLFIFPENIDLYDSDIKSLLSGKTISKPVLLKSSFMEGIDVGEKFHLNTGSLVLDEKKDPLSFLHKYLGSFSISIIFFLFMLIHYGFKKEESGKILFGSWVTILSIVIFMLPIFLFNETKELLPFKWLYYNINFGSTSLFIVFLIWIKKFKIGGKIERWSTKRYAEKP